MKKFVLILVVMASIALIGCATTTETVASNKTPDDYAYRYMESVPVTSKGGFSSWEVKHYVDNSGADTTKAYVTTKDRQPGTVTKEDGKSPMYLKVLVEKYKVFFMMESFLSQENGGSEKNPYQAIISLKYGDTVKTLKPATWFGDRITLKDPEDVKTVFQVFVENQEVSLSIEVTDDLARHSFYSFTLNTKGFEEMYAKAFIPAKQ